MRAKRGRGRPGGSVEVWISVKEAAERLSVPLSTVYAWLKLEAGDGRPVLPFKRLYRRKGIRVRVRDVESVFDRLPWAEPARGRLSFFSEGAADE